MAKPKLTNADFCRSAKRLKCEPAAVKAVSFVESRGEGFYSDGFPVILFERHIFRRFTQGRYNKSHPHLSGPPGNYGAAGQNQRNKFNQAFALNPDAAMKACSWGKFQIMGFNHAVCGFATVGEFVDAMKESEGRQLDAFTSFVIANNLARHLRNLDWAAFARGYNGTGYKKNAYDTKMATAYKRFSKENIDCNNSAAESMPDPSTANTNKPDTTGKGSPEQTPGSSQAGDPVQPPIETKVEQTATVTKTESPEGTVVEESVETKTESFVPKNIPAFIPRFGKQWWLSLGPVGGMFATFGSYMAGLPWWVVYLLGILTGALAVMFGQLVIKHRQSVIAFITRCYESMADPEQHNLIPTPAAGFVGQRKDTLTELLTTEGAR